jgi:ribosomal protein S18 acetylase RimI-like enzyme
LLGRLALGLNYQKQGLGSVLLFDALKRCLRQEIPVFLAIVDAKDDKAKSFYEHYGFSELIEQPNRLFVPMTTVAKLFKNDV